MVLGYGRKVCIGAVAGLMALAWKVRLTRTVALAAIALIATPAFVVADEVRTFAVTVDGKPGGSYAIATAIAPDGTESFAVVASVKVKATLYTYTYELNSLEVWKKGQLASLEAKSNDDGKRHVVTAVSGPRGLKVTVNKEARQIANGVLTATGVRVPAADKPRNVILFDAEDGSETAVRVEPLGACRVMLHGRAIGGTRFKLTGKDVAAEWWFDKNGRVIRQEMKWDGHKVVLELTGVK
jgi:hypothetical protein